MFPGIVNVLPFRIFYILGIEISQNADSNCPAGYDGNYAHLCQQKYTLCLSTVLFLCDLNSVARTNRVCSVSAQIKTVPECFISLRALFLFPLPFSRFTIKLATETFPKFFDPCLHERSMYLHLFVSCIVHELSEQTTFRDKDCIQLSLAAYGNLVSLRADNTQGKRIVCATWLNITYCMSQHFISIAV